MYTENCMTALFGTEEEKKNHEKTDTLLRTWYKERANNETCETCGK